MRYVPPGIQTIPPGAGPRSARPLPLDRLKVTTNPIRIRETRIDAARTRGRIVEGFTFSGFPDCQDEKKKRAVKISSKKREVSGAVVFLLSGLPG